MEILCAQTGAMQVNTYLLWKNEQAVLIDPGDDAAELMAFLEEKGLTLTHILLTHGHFDHMLFAQHWLDQGAKLYVHELDAPALRSPSLNLSQVVNTQLVLPEADVCLHDGDVVREAGMELCVMHTPGHTPGGVCYLSDKTLFSGDTLFYGSYGRLDLPGGDVQDMIASLTRLMQLDGETVAYPGHGMKTKIAWERGNYR